MTGGAGATASGANGSGAGKGGGGGGTGGLTLLCPNCGTRRPLFYFKRRNASAKDGGAKSRTLNCAICRGYTPVDPNQIQDGNDDDDDDDGGDDDDEDEDEGDGDDDDNSTSSSEDDFVYDKDKPKKKKKQLHIKGGHHGGTGDLSGTRGSKNDLRHLQQLTQYMDQLNNFGGGDVSHLPEESDWILTGMGVVLYFFGWASIVTLFVVIVAF